MQPKAIAPVTYDSDYYGWVQQQAELLRSGQFDQLDLENLLEEVESLGRSEKRALTSQIIRLYWHLLKWQYQPHKRSNAWAFSIEDARDEILELLEDNPSFRRDLADWIIKSYEQARKKAARETGLPIDTFPTEPPFTWEATMTVAIEYSEP